MGRKRWKPLILLSLPSEAHRSHETCCSPDRPQHAICMLWELCMFVGLGTAAARCGCLRVVRLTSKGRVQPSSYATAEGCGMLVCLSFDLGASFFPGCAMEERPLRTSSASPFTARR